MRDSVLRSVPPGRAPAVVGCVENQKLPKANARVIRGQAGVGGRAMQTGTRHRTSAIVPSLKKILKWKIKVIFGLPWIIRVELELSNDGTNSQLSIERRPGDAR